MKKYFYLAVVALSLNLTGCYNDDDVWDAINGQEERIAALEAWQKTANENIAALQAIVNGNDYITAVTPVTENGETIGYTISFLHQGDVTLYNGKDGEKGDKGDKGDTGAAGEQGEKGDTPVISVVKQSDGRWYWTLNGELLKDADGNTICASGKDGQNGTNGSNGSSGSSAPTPQLKTGSELGSGYEADAVYLSVDGGNTWTKVSGRTSTGNSDIITNIDDTDPTCVVFTLNDGTTITVPKINDTKLVLTYDGEEIRNGELIIKASTMPAENFSIAYTMGEGYSIEMENSLSNGNWNVHMNKNTSSIDFSNIIQEGNATLKFTLISESNQVLYYQIKVYVQAPPEKVIEKGRLATALANALGLKLEDNGSLGLSKNLLQSPSLNLSEKELTSDDIEALNIFTDLERLYLRNNALTTLDVSQFPKLTSLNCSGNQLETLDISANTALIELNCYDNQLAELKLGENALLQRLNCGNNNLSTLDISANTALIELVCYDNQLAELKLGENASLQGLNCGNNNLSTLDISANTALIELNCYDNQLAELKLGENALLQRLNCGNNNLSTLDVSANTALIELVCGSNKLLTLDVSANTAITNIDCDNNSITQLNLTNNKLLETLWCINNQLAELDLTTNDALMNLYCQHNLITKLDLTANKALQNLNCGWQKNEITLVLTLDEAQQEKWTTLWKNDNERVILSNASSSNSGANFGNGGVY